ncbi:hypothetical protein ACFP2T_27625 [Plantactinospora solaniradicis]|uniref:HEAT repeat domain-containing protein n=1 Tax=Plantactinospora solaniradicis TaxID=1723736 RepID=A0ABW1KDV0_9ACTN
MPEDERLAELRRDACSPSWEVRATTGQRLALLVGDPGVDDLLTSLLLDPIDTAVTYETARSLLRHDDAHAVRLVLTALGGGDGDQADEIMAAISHTYEGEGEGVWRAVWQRCQALLEDPDERVRLGAASVLGLRRPSNDNTI